MSEVAEHGFERKVVERQAKQEQKEGTYWKTCWNLDRAIECFGNRAIDELTRDDIQDARLHIAEQRGNVTANRWLSTVRACLNEATARRHVPGNPASGIKQLREGPPRQRVLDEDEMSRLKKAIEEYPDPHVRCAFWLFIGTGARRSEVLKARWEDINLDTATWRLPNPKSGHPQIILLSDAMVEMLRATPRVPGSPWLIPGKLDPQCHKVDLFRESARLYKAAKIEGAVIHDLRRTFGARIARQAGLHIAQKLLRHSDIRVTETIYAPVDEATLREALRNDESEAKRTPLDTKMDIARIEQTITEADVVETIISVGGSPRRLARSSLARPARTSGR